MDTPNSASINMIDRLASITVKNPFCIVRIANHYSRRDVRCTVSVSAERTRPSAHITIGPAWMPDFIIFVLTGLACLHAAHAAIAYVPNLIACGSIASGCSRVLPVTVNQPLGGTDPYFVQYCSGPGFTCLPVQYPVGDWTSAYVSWLARGAVRAMQAFISCVSRCRYPILVTLTRARSQLACTYHDK